MTAPDLSPIPDANSRLVDEIRRHPYPLLFVTVSGAHLYGFPSPDSDYDLRGAHILPADQVLGLTPPEETLEVSSIRDGVDIDLVTHDAHKFFRLLLRRNGYVLEQLYSPLIVRSTPEFEELKQIAGGCLTRHHVHHYRGFAHNQWRLFLKEQPHRIKPLLYVFRVLLTGIHLLQTGEVEANLVQLSERFRLPYLSDLVARKLTGPEQVSLAESDLEFYESEFHRLEGELEAAGANSQLPGAPTVLPEMNDLLIRIRLG
jgi:uncharacterized protein